MAATANTSGKGLPPIQTETRPSVILTNSVDLDGEAQERSDGEESTTESEKAYLAAEEKRKLALAKMEEDHIRYNSSYVYNGLFSDYLVRSRNNPRTASLVTSLLDHSMVKGAIRRDGDDIVTTEKLLAQVSRLITYYYKSQGDPAFREVRDVKAHFWEIVQYKKEALALNVKVNNWMMICMLRQAKGREPNEDADLRRSRLVGFWSKYHNSHKTIDLRLARTGGGHLALGTGFGGNFWPRPDDETSPTAVRVDPWKLRPCRGKRMYHAGNAGVDEKDAEPHDTPIDSSKAEELPRPVIKLRPSSAVRRPVKQPGTPQNAPAPFRHSSKIPVPQGPPPIPKRVKQALSDASLATGQAAPAGCRKTNKLSAGFGKSMSKSLSSSTPNLPSMLDHAGIHLVEQKQFGLPHRRKEMSSAKDKESVKSATNIYLRACDENFVLPNLLPFCTGDSTKLSAVGQALSDHDMCALTEMFANVAAIEEVDLEGNASLTEESLVPFLQNLYGHCAYSRLRRFCLNRCLRNATGLGIRKVIDNVTHLLLHGVKKLQFLDLGGIKIALDSQLPLCEAISSHTTLHTVGLSDVGLGRNPQVIQCLTALMDSSTITNLDVGWNSFTSAMFQHVGARLCRAGIVKTLSVANCAGASKDRNNPVEYFLENLCIPGSLTKLDLSMNHIDFRGALVMEAALEKNPLLVDITLSHNPLACLGFRSLLRLVARETSGLLYFNAENCWSGSLSQAAEEHFQVFSSTNPAGRYTLDLTRPYDRALLLMLYKTCERFSSEPSEAFIRVVTLSPPNFSHASKDGFGIWKLPTQGRYDITFNLESHMEKEFGNVSDNDFSGFLAKHYSMMRVAPSPSKATPMFCQWKRVDGSDVDQLCMLDAMSKDFILTYSQFDQMCRSRTIVDDIAWRLLPTIKGGMTTKYLAMLHMPSIGEYLKLLRRSVRLLHFNIDNPTGHYNLDLSNCCDYAVAERLMLLDRWEVKIGRRLNREDVSQRGVRCQVRNELYQGKVLFGVSCISEFNMPEFGDLEFDYISGKRPPKDAIPIGQETWDNILVALQKAECTPLNQIEAVTMCSHYFYFNSLQMRALTGICEETSIRCEFLVRLFLRLTDMENEKIFRARFEDQAEFARLQNRLGHLTSFPFIQPEQASFELDLAVYDQRIAFHILLSLRAKESEKNLRDFTFTRPDGTLEPFPQGIPRGWDALDRIPKEGVFRASYNSAPEDRNFTFRATLMERYGFWDPPEQTEVMWWSSLSETPLDVIEFVEFIYTKYRSIWKVFKIIDGVGGNGQIAKSEFEDGIEEMKCKKFDGKDKQERIKTVFRYLDPGGEGTVSQEEWGVLEQLFNEIQLSIKEFVNFCERTFGDDLMLAWKALDDDGSGEIDEHEWVNACQGLGFFGSAVPIFNFLDADDEGTISVDEFKNLEKLQKKFMRKKEEGASPFNKSSLARRESVHEGE